MEIIPGSWSLTVNKIRTTAYYWPKEVSTWSYAGRKKISPLHKIEYSLKLAKP
jgi:hypothetical protein